MRTAEAVMLYKIKYQNKRDAVSFHSNFARSLFASCENKPDWTKIVALVEQISHGDFVPQTIEAEEWLDCDPADVEKIQIPVHGLDGQ